MDEPREDRRAGRPLTVSRHSYLEVADQLARQGGQMHMLCQGCHGCAVPSPDAAAYVASFDEGHAAGYAVSDGGERPGELVLTLGVEPGFQDNEEVVTALLHAVAEDARKSGIRRLVAVVPPARRDPLAMFRSAGIHTLSAVQLGGAAEVVFGLD
jgi:hypothetical protein